VSARNDYGRGGKTVRQTYVHTSIRLIGRFINGGGCCYAIYPIRCLRSYSVYGYHPFPLVGGGGGGGGPSKRVIH